MRKVLIVCPATPGWPEWPMGMAYVLACLDRAGIRFDFVDMGVTPDWERRLVGLLKSERYLAVCSGGLIGFHAFFRRIADLTRRHCPGASFILGGHIIRDGNDTLLFETVGMDYGYFGEAEIAFPRFLEALDRGEDFSDIPGVLFRKDDGTVVRNPQSRLDLTQENILPAWRYFDCDFYIRNSSFAFLGDHLRYMPILSGRGCVGRCGFCSPSLGGFRKRPIAHVIEEIEHLNARYDYDTLCFLNEMFYPRAREVREFCEAYLRVPDRKQWFAQLRVDSNLDVDTLRLMREAGCIAVSVGIESGSDKILRNMNKKISSDQTRRFFANCREAGMPASGTVIVGYDGETEDDLRQTFDLLIEEDISSGEAMLFAYQGTEVYAEALRRGLIADETAHLDACSGNLFQADAREVFCNLTDMDDDTFFRVAHREVRRYYRHLYDTCSVADLTYEVKTSWRWTRAAMRGKCRHCGQPVSHEFVMFGGRYMGSLGPGVDRNVICPKCFRPLAYNPFEAVNLAGDAAHLRKFRAEAAGCERIVLCGVNANLDFVLRTDLFGLDYDRIVGVHPLTPMEGKFYTRYPLVDAERLVGLRPDGLVILDETADPAALRALFADRGAPVPAILRASGDALAERVRSSACLVCKVNRATLRYLGMSAREIVSAPLRLLRRAGRATATSTTKVK
ncbi:radical SAM protein [Pseudodesulfovibrio sp.]|uniref:B12-binding domain-containing radical SAM protein n=1 Tax=Pseudodesulfovibrio sp. TaxID=2035812 RepID=UPI00263386C9|nr:radical SAM protein [Pseudodesulfovibrio sp.]MDD3312783.1 radical SAM protein [Pseudodesulfovibrio sp.]